ncbi:MAG: sensor histidine kinase [Planctomycetota bacterium]
MPDGNISGSYAPPERAPAELIRRQSRAVADSPLVRRLYDAVTECVAILNEQRQIVFCNRRMVDLLELPDRTHAYGMRPGEALGCTHAAEADHGCGTSEYCQACGAVNAFLDSRRGEPQVRECRILRGEDTDALELLVRATPLELAETPLTVIAMTDISHQKRQQVLERTFLHDIMNTIMALNLHCRKLEQADSGSMTAVRDGIHRAVALIGEEVEAHRDLVAAESGELSVRPSLVNAGRLLEEAADPVSELAFEHDCELEIADAAEITFKTDRRLLRRVLCNMMKNAVEASSQGQTVTAGCEQADGRVEFWVHNESHMPRDVQLQLFKRSFTTKGAGRGVGTYSMKLLTEQYLHGTVTFRTSPEEGTTFVASYPPSLDGP